MRPGKAENHQRTRRPLDNVGALRIRIGFWGFLIIILVEYTPNPILTSTAPILCIQGSSNHKASDNGSQNYETELLVKQNHDSSVFTTPLADLQVAISVLCLYYATYVLNMLQLYQFTY